MKSQFLACLALVTSLTSLAAEPSSPRTLFEPGRDADLARFATNASSVELVTSGTNRLLRATTAAAAEWPGVTLRGPADGWDLGAFAVVEVALRNPGSEPLKVFGRVDNPGADGTRNCVTADTTVQPGAAGTLRIQLKRTSDGKLDGKLFGMRGYPVVAGGDATIDPSRVNQILLFLVRPDRPRSFDVETVRAVGSYTPPTAWATDAVAFLPFIDPYGQYRHKTWPGKVASDADLLRRRADEARRLESSPGPADRNRFGGWAGGPQLEATGFFRAEKRDGKWWLVDPEGRLFWSHGVDCVRMFDATPVDERAGWFESFPGDDPAFAEFIVPSAFALKGHYAGRSPRCFSFAGANLRRKYGPDWRTEYPDVIHRRLRSWGLNTIANWSDMNVSRLRRTPYTDSVSSRGVPMIEGSEGYWGKFPDVFDPRFAERLHSEMKGKEGGSAGDPWCIGYFSDNEMSWGDEVSLAEAALRSSVTQAAKKALVDELRERYVDIARLNDRWGTTYVNWDAFLAVRRLPDRSRARSDLERFYTRAAETYFRTVRDAIRAVAPRQLYLGCRFAWVNDRAAAAAAKYCDVVSYNLYKRSVADFVFNGGADVPLIIGEFHFGALDRGMFHTGLVPVADQAARAQAYRDYVEGALRHPQFVGTHWFQWQDQPTTGRVLDEENYQIGLIDIADSPHAETVDAVRAVGDAMYRIRAKPR